MKRRKAKREGFTFVEVMIALTILGFILVMISGTFRLGISSWERESTRTNIRRCVLSPVDLSTN
jgi:prepilin-type N-terminal cleavage/methylation domain-containing protein